MNIEEFKIKYAAFKDSEKISITCDHPDHATGEFISIGKQPAKRNILKNKGEKFICRKCMMKFDNPMNRVGDSRQTDEIINVFCPCSEHEGETSRPMKKACYYGTMEEPYLQMCGRCAQLGKVISEEQKTAISKALKGITRSEEFKEKLRQYMRTPEALEKALLNLIPGMGGGWNKGQETPEEVRKKQSEAILGRTYTEEHKENISKGRKKMLAEQGGFTKEHREKISKAVIQQYQNGFDPNLHHLNGYHHSLKAGKVFYRSSYEKKAYIKLDEDDNVKSYKVESFTVEYFHPVKKIMSNYLVDIEIEYIDGSKKLVEVKPEKWLTDEIVIAKTKAAEEKASQLGICYELWTEMDLFGHVYNEKNMKSFIEKIRNGEV